MLPLTAPMILFLSLFILLKQLLFVFILIVIKTAQIFKCILF